jgi:hypothetical protein
MFGLDKTNMQNNVWLIFECTNIRTGREYVSVWSLWGDGEKKRKITRQYNPTAEGDYSRLSMRAESLEIYPYNNEVELQKLSAIL